jgi:hypothetical protein
MTTPPQKPPLPLSPQAAALKPKAPLPETKATTTPVTEIAPVEIGGPKGPEPTRFGDWERKGRCSDF